MSKRKASHHRHVAVAPVPHGGADAAQPPSALWEWADDDGTFKPYDQRTIDTIEDAAAAGKMSTSLQLGSASYTIDLAGMQQTNDATGFSRAIRRNAAFVGTPSPILSLSSSTSLSTAPASTSTSSGEEAHVVSDGSWRWPYPFFPCRCATTGAVWEFEKEDGEWEAYDQITTRLLEGKSQARTVDGSRSD